MLDPLLGPDMYRRNGFRVTGLAVAADARAIRKYRRKHGLKPGNPLRAATGLGAALARIHNPRTRIVDELTWVWEDKALDGEMCALHDRVVRAHCRALDLETGGETAPDIRTECHQQWLTAMSGWAQLIEDDRVWAHLTARVGALGDPRVTAADVQDLRTRLRDDLLSVCARLAVERTRHGSDGAHYRDHMQALAPWRHVEEVLHEAAAPIVEEIDDACAAARPADGLDAAQRVVEDTADAVSAMQKLFPGPDHLRRRACETVAVRVHQLVVDSLKQMTSTASPGAGPDFPVQLRAARERASRLLHSVVVLAGSETRPGMEHDLASLDDLLHAATTTTAADGGEHGSAVPERRLADARDALMPVIGPETAYQPNRLANWLGLRIERRSRSRLVTYGRSLRVYGDPPPYLLSSSSEWGDPEFLGRRHSEHHTEAWVWEISSRGKVILTLSSEGDPQLSCSWHRDFHPATEHGFRDLMRPRRW